VEVVPTSDRTRGPSRFVRWLAGRAIARTAVVGTAVGIASLAVLAVAATTITAQATRQVRRVQDTTRAWNDIAGRINAEDAALREYLATGGSEYRRTQLAAQLDSARGSLDWLDAHRATSRTELDVIRGAYANYSRIVVQIMTMTQRGASVQGYAELASLAFAPLSDAVLDHVQQDQRRLAAYLSQVDRRTAVVRTVTAVVVPVEAVLFAICALVLVGYQRRTERQSAQRQWDATHDPLTGLGNRSMLNDRLRAAIGAARARAAPFSLLLIDLDRFKEVNDTLGHHCGDELLREIGGRLTAVVRARDVVIRLGGDEFALLLPDSERAAAMEVARRVLAAIREPMQLSGLSVEVDGSVGVATYPADGDTESGLLQHADVAMYAAKRGRHGVVGYDPGQDGHTPSKLSLQSELRRGIQQGELVLHYQPKIDLASGRPSGAEALVRWQHPTRGLLGPSEFVPAAEESGLIDALTVQVLDLALGQVRAWCDAGHHLPVSVNVPARSLADAEFPGTVDAALRRHDVPPEMLVLEITETALIVDPHRANETLTELRARGVHISIDDFGTGYSSISHLRDMPPHELKIDRSLVATMCADPRDGQIVRAVVDLAKNLQLRVVAEGVEDESAMRALSALGCDEAQGYHISRPLPAHEFTQWLTLRHADVR
jgi:diguanylate cyclase (GGDEF)-like protein